MTCPKSSQLKGPLGNNTFLTEKFSCPISHEIMRRPVTAADGMVYDQVSVETWLHTCAGATRSPLTGAPMAPQFTTAYLIRELMEAHATARWALLPPTHGVVRVSKAPAASAAARVGAPAHGPRPFDRRHGFAYIKYLFTAAAAGAVPPACLGPAAVIAGLTRIEGVSLGEYAALLGAVGSMGGAVGAMVGVVKRCESQVLATLGASAGASVGGVTYAALAFVAMYVRHVALLSTVDLSCNHAAVWGAGLVGALVGALVGYVGACQLGAAILGLPAAPRRFLPWMMP